jgi:hypothetical protein
MESNWVNTIIDLGVQPKGKKITVEFQTNPNHKTIKSLETKCDCATPEYNAATGKLLIGYVIPTEVSMHLQNADVMEQVISKAITVKYTDETYEILLFRLKIIM